MFACTLTAGIMHKYAALQPALLSCTYLPAHNMPQPQFPPSTTLNSLLFRSNLQPQFPPNTTLNSCARALLSSAPTEAHTQYSTATVPVEYYQNMTSSLFLERYKVLQAATFVSPTISVFEVFLCLCSVRCSLNKDSGSHLPCKLFCCPCFKSVCMSNPLLSTPPYLCHSIEPLVLAQRAPSSPRDRPSPLGHPPPAWGSVLRPPPHAAPHATGCAGGLCLIFF